MEACFRTAFSGSNGNEDSPCRDLELVAAVKAGSNSAFEELEGRYSRRLYRRIQSITRNHEDAQDALQETFLRAYLALDSFEGRSQFASWLTRIAINSALMVLRKRRARAEVSFEPSSESGEPASAIEVRDAALNPEELYDLRQRSDCARRAISKLKTNLCTAMTIWIEQESSMRETARTLDVSLATVKSRLHRARKQLACSSAFEGSAAIASLISASKREYRIPDGQNRELL